MPVQVYNLAGGNPVWEDENPITGKSPAADAIDCFSFFKDGYCVNVIIVIV